jgi:hypothetical protein
MLKTALLVVAASAVTLTGCAGLPDDKGAGRSPRVTNVTVEGGYVVIDQEPIVIRGTGKIAWNVITPGYEFAPNGIELKNPSPPYNPPYKNAAEEFRCPREKGAQFHCDPTFSLSSRKGAVYRYTIRVQRIGGGGVIEFDPTALAD